MFEFHDPGKLIDKDLELVLVEKYPGDPAIGYVPAYKFRMTLVGQDKEIGHIELRVGSTNHIVMYGGHMGYGVVPEHRGHRYAARACRLLLALAASHALETIWITCNPDNTASRRTCELAGAELVEIVDLPEDTDMYREGERRKCRYRLDLPNGIKALAGFSRSGSSRDSEF
jgi:predicted acetyltransferase